MPQKKSKQPKRRVRRAEDEKELIFKNDDGEDYARVTKKLGNKRIMAYSLELECEINCHVRGNIRGKNFRNIHKDSYVLISFRNLNGEYDTYLKNHQSPEKLAGDVLCGYTDKDVEDLKKAGELGGRPNFVDRFAKPNIKKQSTAEKDDFDEENPNLATDWMEDKNTSVNIGGKVEFTEDMIDFV